MRTLAIVLLFTCGSCGGGQSDGDGGGPGADAAGGAAHWVSGYYAGYERALYPEDAVAFGSLTHIMIGSITPNADGSLDETFDIDAVNGPAMARDLVARAHAAGKKAVCMLGGAGAYDGWVGAASSANRAAFVARLAQAATDYGFDGFDLDWEPLPPGDYADFRALAEDLRAAIPGVILTVPVGWVNSNFPTVDPFFGQVAPLFDQVNLMTYGMADAWSDWSTWHSSALHDPGGSTPSSVASSVDAYLAAGVPAAKLGVGIGFYGSCWSTPATGPGQVPGTSTVVASDGAMSYANIMNDYYTVGDARWDDAAKVPYLSYAAPHGPQGCTFVSYEDATSIAEKGAYARARDLGGTIIWTINQGYLGGQSALLDATAAAFLP